MSKDESLSSKIVPVDKDGNDIILSEHDLLKVDDVKDFIQKLKEEIIGISKKEINSAIDKLAGDALIHSQSSLMEKSKLKSLGVPGSIPGSGTHSQKKREQEKFVDGLISRHGSYNPACTNLWDEIEKIIRKGTKSRMWMIEKFLKLKKNHSQQIEEKKDKTLRLGGLSGATKQNKVSTIQDNELVTVDNHPSADTTDNE